MRLPKISRHAGSKPRQKKLQVVVVAWKDAVFSHEEETPAPLLMFTVGFLVESTDSHVSIAHEVGHDGTYRGTTTVPRGMVQSVMKLSRTFTIDLCD